MSVNVSPQRFRDARLTIAADVAAVLERTRLPPELLIVEINERTVMDDPSGSLENCVSSADSASSSPQDDLGAPRLLTHLRRLRSTS